MKKEDLVKAVAEQTNITKQSASQAVDALFKTITESLKKAEPVTLVGFGSFKTSKRAARTGRNPRTGETISIAATIVPSFTAGKTLKETVNS